MGLDLHLHHRLLSVGRALLVLGLLPSAAAPDVWALGNVPARGPAPGPLAPLAGRSSALATATGCTALLLDGGFEAGPGTPWSQESALGNPLIDTQFPRSQQYGAWLGGDDQADDTLSQAVAIPAGASRVTLSYWWAMHTLEDIHPFDNCSVELRDDSEAVIQVLETITDAAEPDAWQPSEFDLTPYRGRSLRLVFHATTDLSKPTDFFIDDVDLQACGLSGGNLLSLPLVLRVPPAGR